MSNNINGKIYTDHAMLDEIVYGVKQILKNIVLKNTTLADVYETEYSIEQADYLISITDDTIDINYFPFTIDMLVKFGYTKLQASEIINDRSLIPENDIDNLLIFCKDYFISHYIEQNNYYRMLNGLPPYGTIAYDIYIDPDNEKLLKDDGSTDFNFSIPLHMFTNNQISTLNSVGIIDDLKEQYKSNLNYKYLNFLGSKKIDIYTARVGKIWDILYLPSGEPNIIERFKELYYINRDIYYKRTYQKAYAYGSDYYDEIIMMMILCQTFTDMIIDVPELYIRRDIFDLRSVEYFLTSQGVKFFKEIPLKYQIKIVKNLNKLIKYKSTEKNIGDILEIFQVDGTVVYKYYLFKNQILEISEKKNETMFKVYDVDFDDEDSTYRQDIPDDYDFDTTVDLKPTDLVTVFDYNSYADDVYNLEFVKVPLGESYDDYIKNEMYHERYDDVVEQDEYWDGTDDHDYVKERILEKDFTIIGTKYMSLDYRVSLKNYLYQSSYFLGLIFNSNINLSELTIMIPTISNDDSFSIKDLFILLICLNTIYMDKNVLIDFSRNINNYKKNNIDPSDPNIDDKSWKLEDIDFGDEDTRSIWTDDKNETYDFGYNNTTNMKETCYVYDYTSDEGYIIKPGGSDTIIDDDFTIIVPDIPEPHPVKPQEPFDIDKNYDWLKSNCSYMWNESRGRIMGFNMNADIKKIEENLNILHSHFNFERSYSLADMGCDTFIATNVISDIDTLVNIYETNTKCYNTLKELLINSKTQDDKIVYNYVFNELFTSDYQFDFYMLKSGVYAKNYIEILKDRNYTLYSYYLSIMEEKDKTTRQDNVRIIINDIINILEYYISGDNLQYIYSFLETQSFEAIASYINLIINFFKSWKVCFLEPKITYVLDDKYENQLHINDRLKEIKITSWIREADSTRDNLIITPKLLFEDYDGIYSYDMLDLYAYYQAEKIEMIYDGYYPEDKSDHSINSNYDSITEDLDIIEGKYNIDGGNVSSINSNPYFIVNGGDIGARKKLNELDGAGPLLMQDYIIADGQNVLYNDPVKIDFENGSYVIDAGSVDNSVMNTNSISSYIKNSQLYSDVRVNKYKDNSLIINEDGLYVLDDKANESDYLLALKDMNDSKSDYINDIEKLMSEITISSDEQALEDRINELYKMRFSTVNNVLNDYNQNLSVKEIQNYVDTSNSELRQWFIDLGLGWSTFKED